MELRTRVQAKNGVWFMTDVERDASFDRFIAAVTTLAVCIWGFTDVDEKEGGREQKIWLVFGRKDSRDDFGKCRYIEAQYMIIFA